MTGKWHIAMTTAFAVLAGAATSQADELALQQKKEPKKEAKKEPKKEAKKEPKKEVKKEVIIEIGKERKEIRIEVRTPGYIGPVGVAYGVWPGPVLPGMWGGVWGGLWPNSWWMGGPYLYTGWVGPWGGGLARDFGPHPTAGKYYNDCCCGSGAHPWLLPPVFRNYQVPAVSPYWTPRQPVFWIAPSAAPPAIFPGAPAPLFGPAPVFGPLLVPAPAPKPREMKLVPVPPKASVERLYIDALALYFEDNFESSRNHLDAAVKQTPSDARLWYYKALAEKAMGDDSAARQSAEKGAALEIMGVTDKRSILVALERIQGKHRVFLGDLVRGPKALSLETASDIVAKLKAGETTTVTSAK